jgi:hypothetical protein
MQLSQIDASASTFRTADAARAEIERACAANGDLATFHVLGASREGRTIYGVTLGMGPQTVTLVAGAHADEPVGPETLRLLILESLANRDWLADGEGFADLFERFTFRIIPQVNPDGEARNQAWITRWPDVQAYLRHRIREQPGDDIEFGYPNLRPENHAASRFLFDYSPLALHISLHGMGFAEGALLLVERHAVASASGVMAGWRDAVAGAGLRLHDHDRGGDKGFRYYGPGFWSTPEGRAMQAHFRQRGDEATARLFHLSSMELARLAGYDAARDRRPLCLVTELPLFVIGRQYERQPGVPAAYLDLQAAGPEIQARLAAGRDASDLLAPFALRPLPLATAVRLQLRAIELGLEAVA